MSAAAAFDLPRTGPVALLVGQDRQETPARHLARGMREAGWQVDLIDSENVLAMGRTLLARASTMISGPVFARILATEIERRAMASGADWLVFVKTIPLKRAAIERLKHKGTRLAVWYPDVSFAQPGVPDDFFGLVDAIVTTKSYHLPHIARVRPDLPVALIHHGYCEDVHYPMPAEPVIDVAYVGNASPAKRAAIEALHGARPSLRIAVAGNGWPAGAPWIALPAMAGEQMSRLFGVSKLALGLHYGRHGGEGWEDLVSARTFEIPACGTFMIHPDNREVRSLFEPDREIGVFDGPDSLIAAVDHWLGDDAARRTAAWRAQERARPAYGYRHRGMDMARFLGGLGRPGRA